MVMDVTKFPVTIQTVPYVTPNVQIYYPRVIGLPNQLIQEEMNRQLIRQVEQLMALQGQVQIQGNTQMEGFYELKSNERGVLSLTQANYAYTPQMAHGMTFLKSLTFDVMTGKEYPLKDLFKPNSDYVQRISDMIGVQIEDRDLPVLEEFKGIGVDQEYYIADKALVIYFQLYDLAPYYVGFPMFPLSVYQLQDIIAENSPLGRMLADI